MTKPKPRSAAAAAECQWELVKYKNDLTEDDREEWERQCKKEEFSMTSIGFRLKIERMKSGLTQWQVADALGVNETTILSWEKGYNEISLRDAHRYVMLLQKIPHDRPEWDVPSLNSLTVNPMVSR